MSTDIYTQAIAELDRRVEASTQGPWVHQATTVSGYSRVVDALGDAITAEDEGGEVFSPADAELIVTLHQTIQAQRDTLLTGRMIQEMQLDSPLLRFVLADANRLARSILGEL